MSKEVEPQRPTGYRVGAVRRLTGLSDHTLRAWERRYAVIRPSRTEGGMRVYSEDDVARLQLLKALCDCGEPIGSIARLSDEQLRSRLGVHAGARRPEAVAGSAPRRIALVEPGLARQIDANQSELAGLEVSFVGTTLDDLLEKIPDAPPDVLLVGLDALRPDLEASLARCLEAAEGAPVVVCYAYAQSQMLDRILRAGGRLVRMPIRLSALRQRLSDWVEIERARSVDTALRAAATDLPRDLTEPASERLFSDAALSALTEARSTVDCECPAHLAEIVRRLADFEAYSASCTSASPRDADLHACLARATGHARAIMEKMLARVCEHDGIRF